jgi:HK97 family phage major capsid protein
MLMFQVPIQYHANGSWIMNQRTMGLMFSMSDANGRPILIQDLQNPLRWMLLGHPVVVSQFWPDVAPGATSVAFGDWKSTYLIVNRRALTILPDPFSLGWCVLYRLYARLGGGIICPNAARLLRVK